MLFFQDDKDKLRDTLADLQRQISNLQAAVNYRIDELTKQQWKKNGFNIDLYPHGAKKDGTPRAKPGRKPKGVKA